MRHSSLTKVSNIYQWEAAKSIDHKHSPAYRRSHQSKNSQARLINPELKRTIQHTQKGNSQTKQPTKLPQYSSAISPERKRTSGSGLNSFRIGLGQKLQEQSQMFRMLRSKSQQQDYEFKENRRTHERIRSQDKRR